jgi:hypothetical protein
VKVVVEVSDRDVYGQPVTLEGLVQDVRTSLLELHIYTDMEVSEW